MLVDSVVLCRDDRDDSLSDEEAVAAGYCLSQFESVRGEIERNTERARAVVVAYVVKWSLKRVSS